MTLQLLWNRILGMRHKSIILTAALLISSWSAHAQTPPNWFDVNSYIRQVQKKAKADKVTFKGPVTMERFETRKVDLGVHKLTMVIARFGAGNSDEAGGYNVTEVRGEPSTSAKPLYQAVDKVSCSSNVGENLVGKKLGAVGETQIYFTQVQLLAPSCPDSEMMSPKIFLVLQGTKGMIEKVYQSDISENGKYRIDFNKSRIVLEYAKNINAESKPVQLDWDDKTQKFTAGGE